MLGRTRVVKFVLSTDMPAHPTLLLDHASFDAGRKQYLNLDLNRSVNFALEFVTNFVPDDLPHGARQRHKFRADAPSAALDWLEIGVERREREAVRLCKRLHL
jgi:hypothetical protein